MVFPSLSNAGFFVGAVHGKLRKDFGEFSFVRAMTYDLIRSAVDLIKDGFPLTGCVLIFHFFQVRLCIPPEKDVPALSYALARQGVRLP